ncbi:hypothetical protein LTR53_014076 [Teratosphaeriaceae sp. CCFEE 6253]|nr:hypothetical protein LTR53_014076 [Teratosphaeriaceae sp. CCFEE 6253]
MLFDHVARSRVPLARPLRPPKLVTRKVPRPRLFTQNTQLLLLAQRATSRPQLPYLAQPIPRINGGLLGPNPHLARLLSTENRQYLGEQVYLATKWTVVLWVFAGLGSIAYMGYDVEREERVRPTPSEWTFLQRWGLRNARAHMGAGEEAQGAVNWPAAGTRLEESIREAEGTAQAEEGRVLIDGAGRVGLDVSGKSWPWRAGYHEVVMGCAAASEHLDGFVRDKTRGLAFPQEVVIGPSNPDPRPLPAYMHTAPKEEDCVRAFEPPETYYMRVLTGKGFTTSQTLDAALAYANWLEFKGQHDSAEEVYRRGLDIATSGLPDTTLGEQVIDAKSGVLKVTGSATDASPNLLRATTALAIHQARTGNVSSALPILLSVLRARRTAPVDWSTQPVSRPAQEPTKTDIATASNFLQNLFQSPQFPAPPPSGDLPLIRQSDKPTCDESELMLYIGEILFATSPSSSEGLGWTRQAVTIAEANLQADATEVAERIKCKACLTTGVGNWENMLQRLSEQQGSIASREGGRVPAAGALEWRGWFGGDGGQKGKTLDELQVGLFEEELRQVERLKARIVRGDLGGEVARQNAGGARASLWFAP